MPINCLIKCLINFWTFRALRAPKQINGLWATVYGQRSMVYGLSPFVSSSLPLLVPLTLWLFDSLTLSPFVSLSLSPFDSLTLPLFDSLTLPLFDSLSFCLFDSSSLSLLVEKFRQKKQQFWAIFQRFDINIFNLSEHFSPPNFAYSARNFSLPSPN